MKTHTFIVRPDPKAGEGNDHRFQVTLPLKYVNLGTAERDAASEVTAFSFPYRFPSGNPITKVELGEDDVVVATIAWLPPRSVGRRLDGSWLNYYLRYSVQGEAKYGLQSARGPDRIDTSILFYSIEDGVMIECKSVLSEPLRTCHMTVSKDTFVSIEANFRAELLPFWKQIISKTATIAALSSFYK